MQPLSHETGVGYITPTRAKADYADGLAKGRPVHLYLVEVTGAQSPALVKALTHLHRVSRARATQDSPVYGLSPRTFLEHHMTAISAAAVTQDARAIHAWSSDNNTSQSRTPTLADLMSPPA